ncbi:MAG TPA: cobamide remodeling phosphodiesterase CbiR [Anaerolineales bacterium]|nr:cobamide remodeling phosphodiesterase CbiR [Anaerolineales bacterium]
MKKHNHLPFRLGTTSFIVPADLLTNVRFLAGRVHDIEVLLFEVDDGYNVLPGPEVWVELAELARAHDLTYTVHLPLDLQLAGEDEARAASLEKVRAIMAAVGVLDPWAYVVHLEGAALRGSSNNTARERWRERAVASLAQMAGWAGGAERLAVENVEGYPPEFTAEVVERIGVSRCFDIGHLWRDRIDPWPYLDAWLERTRVIHLHGLGKRDHDSVARVPDADLDALLARLLERYRGVLTLEVFNQANFESSLDAVARSLDRLRAE